jgi:hypothetical protein
MLVLLASAAPVRGQAKSVVDTLHNLSVSGPGDITAVDETEVCKFCHIPHSATAPIPLWGRPLPAESLRYEVPGVRRQTGIVEPAPQPDGSSRLCLSCHDGTIALGELTGRGNPVRMKGADRLTPGRRGFLGTDLSGSHPISFVIGDVPIDAPGRGRGMGVKPTHVMASDPDVRLDEKGKMQCTTCHSPHEDLHFEDGSVPHFWVKPSVEEVCLTCHELS